MDIFKIPANPEGYEVVIDYLKTNFPELISKSHVIYVHALQQKAVETNHPRLISILWMVTTVYTKRVVSVMAIITPMVKLLWEERYEEFKNSQALIKEYLTELTNNAPEVPTHADLRDLLAYREAIDKIFDFQHELQQKIDKYRNQTSPQGSSAPVDINQAFQEAVDKEAADTLIASAPTLTSDVDRFFYDTYSRALEEGVLKSDRTQVGTKAVVGVMGRFDISHGRAALTNTKEVITKSSYREMIDLFVAGTSSIKKLRDHKIGIWDDWAIPGTQVFDEPREPYLLNYRVQLAHEQGLSPRISELIDAPDSTYRGVEVTSVDLYHLDRGNWIPVPTLLDESDLAKLCQFLTHKGIPTHRIPGGKKVSIHKRLSRVTKNDTAMWDKINLLVDAMSLTWPKDYYDTEGTLTTLTVFREGSFQTKHILSKDVSRLETVLDSLGVNAYPLIDADIGEGCYGRQWRHWQDTQLCGESTEEFQAYMEQGYELVGTFKNAHNNAMTCVMHREVDQLQEAIKTLTVKPDDRRMIVTAWNPGRIWQAALPACHFVYQFISHEMTLNERWAWYDWNHAQKQLDVRRLATDNPEEPLLNTYPDIAKLLRLPDGQTDGEAENLDELGVPRRKLYCQFNMRSWDLALGAAFNISQYALLTHMVAHVTGHATAELIVSAVDAHLYLNTIDGIKEQMTRSTPPHSDPRISFKRKVDNIDDFVYEDIELTGYNPLARIHMPVAV